MKNLLSILATVGLTTTVGAPLIKDNIEVKFENVVNEGADLGKVVIIGVINIVEDRANVTEEEAAAARQKTKDVVQHAIESIAPGVALGVDYEMDLSEIKAGDFFYRAVPITVKAISGSTLIKEGTWTGFEVMFGSIDDEGTDLGTIIFIDSNHEVVDNQNVSDKEVADAIEKITNIIKPGIASLIPGAELNKDYTIDSSQIKPGDLSRGAEVFINAKEGSTLIKEGTYTSAWVLFVNKNLQS